MNTPHHNPEIAEMHADQRELAALYRGFCIENLRMYKSTRLPFYLRHAFMDDAMCQMWSCGELGIATVKLRSGGAV